MMEDPKVVARRMYDRWCHAGREEVISDLHEMTLEFDTAVHALGIVLWLSTMLSNAERVKFTRLLGVIDDA